MTTTHRPQITARRVRRGSKTEVQVRIDGAVAHRFSTPRAARSSFVVATHGTSTRVDLFRTEEDAQAEVDRAMATEYVHPVTSALMSKSAAAWSVIVPIEAA